MSIVTKFMARVDKTNTCWLWKGIVGNHGRGRIQYKLRRVMAHRVAYEIFIGPIPEGLCVCHHCDVPRCVNPDHLFLGTQADNVADMINKGRGARGENLSNTGESNPAAKLTFIQVDEIRKRYAQGNISQARLGKEYGMSQVMIGNIIRRKCWK